MRVKSLDHISALNSPEQFVRNAARKARQEAQDIEDRLLYGDPRPKGALSRKRDRWRYVEEALIVLANRLSDE